MPITDANAGANEIAEVATAGASVGVTADAGVGFTYSLLDDAGGRFTIDANTGVVTVANPNLFDFENATTHNLVVQAVNGGTTETQVFTVNVLDVEPVLKAATALGPVNEGATAAGNVNDVGGDVNGVVYSIVNIQDAAKFQIDASGNLSFIAAPNFEAPTDTNGDNVYNVTVEATDQTGATVSRTFNIQVANVAPTAPSDADAAANSVSEGASNGAMVGVDVNSTDVSGGTVTYSLTDDAGGRFAIDANTGAVTVANAALLNFEGASSHLITVQASDGTATSTANFTINVTNVTPTAPADGDAAANSVAEDAINGATVGVTASSTDVNGGAVSYSLTDNAGGRFAIDVNTGVVTVADASLLNFEGAASHQVTVQASDGTATTTTDFTINVTNAAPSAPADGDAGANSVAENAANGATVGVTAGSTDVNGGSVTFSLTDSAGGRFAIDANTGVVTVANASLLDFETATSHIITVQASDGTSTSSANFTINVADVAPSAPADSNAGANSVSEGASNGATVGITASSTEGGGSVAYSLFDNAGGRFAIDANTGVVTVADGTLLDYESATSHNITVRATAGVSFTDQVMTVNVTNVTPTAPADGDAAANSVAEDAVNGATVGVTASSTDVNGGAVSYSLTNNAGGRFAVDANTGVVTVADASLLNFEGATSHLITVQATDGTATTTTDFTINVTNAAPSAPADTDAAADSVAENAANGTAVGIDVNSTDVNGGSVTYSLTDSAGGRFAIDATTGVVTVANASLLDFEAAASHLITVQASDGTSASTANFTINVADVAPSAPADNNAGANSVSEGASNGATVGVTASASDGNGALTYSLTDNAGGRFAIDANTGVVTVADASLLNYEGATSHLIAVQASDGLNTSTSNFTINVTNAAPAVAADGDAAANSVAENASNGATVGITAASTDVNGGAVSYSLTNNAGGRFAIDANTGVVTVADASLLNFEAASSHLITVQASDGTDTSSQSFTINVTDAPPSAPADADGAANSIAENASNGATVGVMASASDGGGSLSYSLTNNAGGRFAINAATGLVTLANASLLDFEAAASHLITVQASDGLNTSTADFTINVANVAPSLKAANALGPVVENTTSVGDVDLAGGDITGVTYSILAGLDGALFTVNAGTGVLSFIAAPDFENPTDIGANNGYQVTVQATDGVNTVNQTFDIAVTDAPASIINGTSGNDTINNSVTAAGQPFAGNEADTINGLGGNDNLSGLGGNDTLNGGNGSDTLDGGTGADTMAGGSGNDTYVVDNAGDVTTELTSGGTDTVLSSISYALSPEVEKLVLTGSSNIDGTGTAANNTITGNSGNNILDGAGGSDKLLGGLGDDSYIVNGGDTVTEASGAGLDTVFSSASSFTLSSNVENLVLTGIGDIKGTGNGLANVMTGNSGNNSLSGGNGNDRLTGGAGNDTLSGNSGNDTFVFAAGFGNDTISGFSAGAALGDVIEFDSAVFADFAAVIAATTDIGSSLLITSGTDTIKLSGIGNIATLNANDFAFV